MTAYDIYFSNVPSVICVRGSQIAAVNKAAETFRIPVGEKISDSMPPLDALRFQAAFEAQSSKEPLVFSLSGFHGYRAAAAVFQSLMNRRFAVVCFFHSVKEAEMLLDGYDTEINADDPRTVISFLSSLSKIPSSLLDVGERYGLIDLRAAAEKCIADITCLSDIIDCKVDISENKEMAAFGCHPVNVSLTCFIQMIAAMLICMNDVSQSRIIGVRLCCYGGEREIRMSADTPSLPVSARDIESLANAVPSSSVYLTLCSFIASMCSCGFYCRRSSDSETLTLILSFDDSSIGLVDFKSRDQFAYYSESFDYILQQLRRLDFSRHKAELPKEE